MKNFRDNFLKYGTYFLIFILPLLYFGNLVYPYVTSKTFFLYGVTDLLFTTWLYALYVDKSYRLTKKQLIFFIPIVLYILWMTLAGIFAINPRLAFWSSLGRGTGLITLYHLFALSLIIASLTKRYGLSYIENFFKWCLLGSFVLAISVWGSDKGLSVPIKTLLKSNGGGFIGNSSLAAPYLLFSLFFGLYLLLVKKINLKQKILISIILITIILSPLFLDIHGKIVQMAYPGTAKGATIGIIVGLGFAFVSYLALHQKKIYKILGIILMVISLVAFSVSWIELMKPDTKFHQKFTEIATGTRFIFWSVAQKSIDDHPWFGYGPENYMIASQKNFNPLILKKENKFETWDDRAHNIYFDTGVSGGYPAIAFYILFITSLLYGFYKLNKNGIVSNLQAGIFSGLIIGYVFQNLFVFDSLVSLTILFIFTGMTYGLLDIYLENPKEKNNKIKNKNTGRGLTAGILIIIFIILFSLFSYSTFRKAWLVKYVMNLGLDQRYQNYERLLNGSPVGNDWDVGSFAQGIYTNYNTYIKELKINEKNIEYVKKDLESFINYLEKVMASNPNDYRLHINTINLYNTWFLLDKDKASNSILTDHVFDLTKQALKLAPNNPQTYWSLAVLYARTKNIQGIIDSLNKAISLEPTNPNSWQMLLTFAKSSNNKDFYNKVLSQAREKIPDFTDQNI